MGIDFDQTLRRLSDTKWQIAIVVSGGGTGAVATCLRRPGASGNFVEATIPYSRKSMRDYLGRPTAGPSASIETARQLAIRAWQRAGAFSDQTRNDAIGLSLVAALPTVPVRDQVNVRRHRRPNDSGCDLHPG